MIIIVNDTRLNLLLNSIYQGDPIKFIPTDLHSPDACPAKSFDNGGSMGEDLSRREMLEKSLKFGALAGGAPAGSRRLQSP